jgi:ABC-2 type transport system permease protein
MLAIYKRELRAYFNSPMAYVLIGLFILLSSIFFVFDLFSQVGDYSQNLETSKLILVFIIPILTMRILAEDRRNGTEVLLITSPVSITSIVVGKFLAAYSVFFTMVIITFIYPIIFTFFGAQITAQLVGAYIGFILLGGAMLSIGVFASSLTENQIIAAIIGFVTLLAMWMLEPLGNALGGNFAMVFKWFSLISRYTDFATGVLGLAPIVYFLTFTAVCLFLTIRVIEKRRWSQG